MPHLLRLIIVLLCASVAQTCTAQALAIKTPRGAHLEVVANFPAGVGPFPTVVLAPGAGYHMALPIMEQAALQFVERGIAVYRFNWAYFSADPKTGHPSKDLMLEVEDMSTVLKLAQQESRVAADKIFVGGKSLGSGVAWRLLAANKDLRGGLLLTPICSRIKNGLLVAEAEEHYPGAALERRPLLFISGENDPVCATKILYHFAATMDGPVRVAVLSGNHGFEVPSLNAEASEAAKQRNAKFVALLAADFVAQHAQP